MLYSNPTLIQLFAQKVSNFWISLDRAGGEILIFKEGDDFIDSRSKLDTVNCIFTISPLTLRDRKRCKKYCFFFFQGHPDVSVKVRFGKFALENQGNF